MTEIFNRTSLLMCNKSDWIRIEKTKAAIINRKIQISTHHHPVSKTVDFQHKMKFSNQATRYIWVLSFYTLYWEHRSILHSTICSLDEDNRVNKWPLAPFDLNKGCDFQQRHYFGSCHLPQLLYLESKTAFEANYAKNISKEKSVSLTFSTQKFEQRSTNVCSLFYTITSFRLNWNVHIIQLIALTNFLSTIIPFTLVVLYQMIYGHAKLLCASFVAWVHGIIVK